MSFILFRSLPGNVGITLVHILMIIFIQLDPEYWIDQQTNIEFSINIACSVLTYCSLASLYNNIKLGQHWLR